MMWGVAAIGFFSGIISGMGIGGGTILIPALLFCAVLLDGRHIFWDNKTQCE